MPADMQEDGMDHPGLNSFFNIHKMGAISVKFRRATITRFFFG
jgi:hypothetical protein